MQGTRLYKEEGEEDFGYRISTVLGAYGNTGGDTWLCTTPNGLFGNISKHQITQHEDGTITVSPSILVRKSNDGLSWHGYLERGIWREC